MMKTIYHLAMSVALLLVSPGLLAQRTVSPSALPDAEAAPSLEQRIDKLAALLTATQLQVEQSQKELAALRSELATTTRLGAPPVAAAPSNPAEDSAQAVPLTAAEDLETQSEQLQVLQAEVKQHEQTKVETESKYPIKLYGLVLFNAFSNAGLVDNPDLPTVAVPSQPGMSHGTLGGSIRQTVLGIHATGPHLGNAATAADVSTDFFGGLSYDLYGSTTGNLRLRTADVSISGENNVVHLGVATPLISPLSPTSYATVAIPSLAWAGNLWLWSPQVRYQRRVDLRGRGTVQLEAGLLDPAIVNEQETSPYREVSAGELARRPAVEGRASYHFNLLDRELVLGVGGYRARENYGSGVNIGAWAVTSDWQIPLSRWIQFEGEFYRGLGLGSLGGGAYKDVISGNDPVTGLNRTLGLNAIGGWGQIKVPMGRMIEANLSAGQDSGYGADLRKLILTNSTNSLETMARNRVMVGNVVFRPKTYLIFSPEYRRIMNWQNTGPAAVANIFTISAGYQF